MTDKRLTQVTATACAALLTSATYGLQMYQLTYLEESHIMLYDTDWLVSEAMHPGGVAQIVASLLSQFFICRYAGPLIMGVVYWLIMCRLGLVLSMRGAAVWCRALILAPCLCLMLCLETTTYALSGTVAMLFAATAINVYCSLCGKNVAKRIAGGVFISAATYAIAGSAAIAAATAMAVLDICGKQRLRWGALAYPAAAALTGYIYYLCGMLHSVADIFTPAMYYEMGSTYYMMIYAECTLPLIALSTLAKDTGTRKKTAIAILAALIATETATAANIYGKVHSRANSELQQQRYYARHGMWDAILQMPYDGSPTPYTSYRFLALAEKGRLSAEVGGYRPFIAYLLENKPKVRRIDQQVYSDIYYRCDYMAAARHSAFDTDIVTPGAFNPYETLKLAEINILTGDYAVADKLLRQLEKTLMYKSEARNLRRYLYNDALVDSDPVLGPKRRAIPAENHYTSPKGIQRDLKGVIDSNPGQVTAREFYKTLLILTNQSED